MLIQKTYTLVPEPIKFKSKFIESDTAGWRNLSKKLGSG